TDQNTYIVGNIMPVATTSLNKIYRKKRSIKTISFIEEDGKPSNGSGFSIFGSWVGEHEFQQISLTLSNESNHSYYNGEKCEAIYNSPQSGIVSLKFDDDKELFMRIEEVGADFMTVYFRNSNEKITFKR
ncbi:MAG: hypothetical protein K2M10_06890, partial [Muribaculaceae bacterium]|nr:hypothetical protein [Muribaculaceae bacterium]